MSTLQKTSNSNERYFGNWLKQARTYLNIRKNKELQISITHITFIWGRTFIQIIRKTQPLPCVQTAEGLGARKRGLQAGLTMWLGAGFLTYYLPRNRIEFEELQLRVSSHSQRHVIVWTYTGRLFQNFEVAMQMNSYTGPWLGSSVD